uniref:Cna B-type domain-containing protein n=1 Tax=Eubacterium cellulosolvens TaxID=29322 RepID=UPI0004896B8F|nr:Cna B-type domain-containing protein [[Eubacterium] cellulosolvens]
MRNTNRFLTRALGLLMAGSLSVGGSFLQAAPVAAADNGGILNNCCTKAALSDETAAATAQLPGTAAEWNVDPTKEYKLNLTFAENAGSLWNGSEMVYDFPSFFEPSVNGTGGINGTSQSGVTTITASGANVSAYYEIGPDGKLHVYPNGQDEGFTKMKGSKDDTFSVNIDGYFVSEGSGKEYALVSGSSASYTIDFPDQLTHQVLIRNVNVNGEVLADGAFKILNSEGKEINAELSRDSKGLLSVSLPAGSYQLVQTQKPAKTMADTKGSYNLAATVSFQVGEDGAIRYSSAQNSTFETAADQMLDVVNLTGADDDPELKKATIKLSGHVVFEDNNDADKLRPNKGGIRLHLLRDGKELASTTVNEAHKWEFSSSNNIRLSDAGRYELKVDPIPVKDGQNPYTITVNKYVDEQRLFFNVVAVHIAKKSSSSTSKSGSVKTGDAGGLLHYLILFLAAGTLCIALFRVKNNRRKKNQIIGLGLSVVMAASVAAGVGARDVRAEVSDPGVSVSGTASQGSGESAAKNAEQDDSKAVSDGTAGGTSSKSSSDSTAPEGKEDVVSGSDKGGKNVVVSPTEKAADGKEKKNKAKNSKSGKNAVTKKDADENLVSGEKVILVGVGGKTLELLNPYFKSAKLTRNDVELKAEAKESENSFDWTGLSPRSTYELELTLAAKKSQCFSPDQEHPECVFALPSNFRLADSANAEVQTNLTIKGKDKDGREYSLSGNKVWSEMSFEAKNADASDPAKAIASVKPMIHVKFNTADEDLLKKFTEDESVAFTVTAEVFAGSGKTSFCDTDKLKVIGTTTTTGQRVVNFCAQTPTGDPLEGVEFELRGSNQQAVSGVSKWTSHRNANGKSVNSLHAVLLDDGIYYLHVNSVPEGVTKPTHDLEITVGGSEDGITVSGESGGRNVAADGTAYVYMNLAKTTPKSVEKKVTLTPKSLNEDLTPLTSGQLKVVAKTAGTIADIDGDAWTVKAGYSYTLQESATPSDYKKAADRTFYVDSAGHLFLNSGEVKAADPKKIDSGYVLNVLHLKNTSGTESVHVWAQTSWNDMENLDNCRPTDLTITVRKSTQSTALYDNVKVADKEASHDFQRQPVKENNKSITYTVNPKKTPTKDYTVAMVDTYKVDGMQMTTIIYRHVPKKSATSTPKLTATTKPSTTQKATGSLDTSAGTTTSPTPTDSASATGSAAPGVTSTDASSGTNQSAVINVEETDEHPVGNAAESDDGKYGEDVDVR